jgi:hypothetical protein
VFTLASTRVLVKQGSKTYRLLRAETSFDGSLIVFLDRDPRPWQVSTDPPSSDEPLPYARFTIHTSGTIHRYEAGKRRQSIYIEPLYSLTRTHPIGIVSIPRLSRLDELDGDKHVQDISASLEIPEDVSERINFLIEIGPKGTQPETFGVALNYEVYSALVRVIPSLIISDVLVDYFITMMPPAGVFDAAQTDPESAELAFYRAAYGGVPAIYRENSGAYVTLAAVPMRIPPKLKVSFNRNDPRIEQIAFDYHDQPSYKVRFWICDKGGRNNKDDLRSHIISIELDSRL